MEWYRFSEHCDCRMLPSVPKDTFTVLLRIPEVHATGL